MSTLEDKILGEKNHYYCSSDEEEERDDAQQKPVRSGEETGRIEGCHKWNGYSVNVCLVNVRSMATRSYVCSLLDRT